MGDGGIHIPASCMESSDIGLEGVISERPGWVTSVDNLSRVRVSRSRLLSRRFPLRFDVPFDSCPVYSQPTARPSPSAQSVPGEPACSRCVGASEAGTPDSRSPLHARHTRYICRHQGAGHNFSSVAGIRCSYGFPFSSASENSLPIQRETRQTWWTKIGPTIGLTILARVRIWSSTTGR